MKLLDVILAADGRVSGGSEFLWNCWGVNARFMDFADIEGQEVINCVFDCKTFIVYEIQVHVPHQDKCFIWWNQDYALDRHNEARVRNIDPMLAYDNVYYSEVDQSTILEYVKDVSATYYDQLSRLA